MSIQKYIGIENELISFKPGETKDVRVQFDSDAFDKLKKRPFHEISCSAIRTKTGNGYYVDGSEIEILTPPIPLNKGFATRLTDSLIIGRNHVIKNTPGMKHTGYSMHWNLSHDQDRISVQENLDQILNSLSIPFQLFGLTPASCGYNIRADKYYGRFEVLGDSLTNEEQINATALLMGAYSAALDTFRFIEDHIFPIELQGLSYLDYAPNTLSEGRHQSIPVIIKEKAYITQAQNVLELFYDWLSPFVYALGEKEEISNLEAFIKGEKKLEMDDQKYFNSLERQGAITGNHIYWPITVETPKGKRSQTLHVSRKDDVKVPLEGTLLGMYASNSKKRGFRTEDMDWDAITIERNNKDGPYQEIIAGTHRIYMFAAEQCGLEYHESTLTTDIIPNNIIKRGLRRKLAKRTRYDEHEDQSA